MQQDGRKVSTLRATLLLLMVAAAVCIPGCKGCSCRSTSSQAKTPEELEKELEKRREMFREEQKKVPLRELRYASLPHGPMGAFPALGESVQNACVLKPGHWSAATFSAVANNFDIIGNLELAAGKEIPLPGMPFALDTQRSVAFPKGQTKTLDTLFYLPEDRTVAMRASVDARRRSGGFHTLGPIVKRMPYYQFHFVVLARYPELYGYLRALDAVGSPTNEHYRISLISPGRRTPLPSQSLFWTSTAYVLWDDADPEALSLDQQVALLDWIHWGGQLIVSGPETLDTLRNSFLADYLPATGEGTRELVASDFDEINRHWTLPIRGLPGPPLAPISTWSGVKLKKHPDSQFVPKTGELLVERRVGRGRVVVSAFKLAGREVTTWPGWDGFFNGCLMRRPAREYTGTIMGGDLSDYSVFWKDRRGSSARYDTDRLCQLRYFSRDTGRRPVAAAVDLLALGDEGNTPSGSGMMPADEGYERVPVMNFAAWNDFSAVADAARAALADAAGIEVPDRSFVVWIVASYLIVLVPLNWLVFKLLGRVEWAWIAAPVIAVVCAVVVIRQAQLDIGFVRSESEVAIVEMQGDYPRGHVTRYTTFYTSLGTGYDFEFDELNTQILPFPSTGDPKETGLKMGESPQRVSYQYGSQVRLDDLRVRSSSAQMTHCEQMLDLGGPIQWLEPAPGVHRVVNRTGYQLRDAGVVRKTVDGRIVTAWLGTLDPEETGDAAGRWEPVSEEEAESGLWSDRRNRVTQTGAGVDPGTLTLHPLVPLAENTEHMQPGDVRLIAWTDEPLPGMNVHPVAPQKRRVTLIVANLRYGFGDAPEPDTKSRYDFVKRANVFREDPNDQDEKAGDMEDDTTSQ